VKLAAVLEKVRAQLDQGKAVRSLDLSDDEQALLKPFCLITAKPAMYVANVKDDGFENNPHLDAVRKYAEARTRRWWPCAPRSRPKSPIWTTPTRPRSWPTWAWKSRA
jgi:ribosome-binding ATPase YchF (GTP1/OBG family)